MSNNIPQKPYKPLTPFRMFVKHNFPFIEATYEARDNYDLLGKVVAHLNTVEYNQGIAQENIEALYNFLDTLELQDEVNKKLDEMAQNGTLTNLIGQYIDPYILEINSNINSFENQINTNMDSLENQIQGIASGSPAGVYATVEALTTADPDHSKIYIVNSDGYWYYYNTTTNTWTPGGPYQASVESDVEADLINETGMEKLTPTLVNKAIRTNGNTVTNLSGENVEGFNAYVVNATFGDVFTIFARGNSTYRIWTFIDENGNVLTTEYSALNTTNNGIVIHAPLNASKLIINDNANKAQYKGEMNITKIDENVSEIENTKNAFTTGILEQKLVFEVGAINESGLNTKTSKRLRTVGYYPTKENMTVKCTSNYKIVIEYYDSNYVFQTFVAWNENTRINTNYSYFRVQVRPTSGTPDMLASEGENVTCEIELINEDIPTYLQSEITTSINSIMNKQTDENITFIWLTDSHTNPDSADNIQVWNDTLKSINAIAQNIPIDFILHTGDIVDQNYVTQYGATDPQVFQCISESLREVHNIDNRLLLANGNHDGVNANGYGNKQWYYFCNGKINDNYPEKPAFPCSYSYKDFPYINTRVITLSCPDSNPQNTYYWGYSDEQLEWLANIALDTPDNYNVIIAVHTPFVEKYNGQPLGHTDTFSGIINAYHNHTSFSDSRITVDYSNKVGTKVIIELAGHTHFDALIDSGVTSYTDVTNTLPCKILVSGCSWFYNGTPTWEGASVPERTMNTSSEILFNVCIYNPTQNTLELIRVGAGNDRTVYTN